MPLLRLDYFMMHIFQKKKQPGEAYSDDLVFSICNYIYETENISLDSLNNHIEQFILKQMDYINENYTLDDSQQEADFIC